MTLYIDLDGVLADFASAYSERFNVPATDGDFPAFSHVKLKTWPHFYVDLPLKADARTLWGYIQIYRPVILTGVPADIPEAAEDKRLWVRKNFGRFVPVITCLSKDKSIHLGRNGRCTIYEDRPPLCREYKAGSDLLCAEWKPETTEDTETVSKAA